MGAVLVLEGHLSTADRAAHTAEICSQLWRFQAQDEGISRVVTPRLYGISCLRPPLGLEMAIFILAWNSASVCLSPNFPDNDPVFNLVASVGTLSSHAMAWMFAPLPKLIR